MNLPADRYQCALYLSAEYNTRKNMRAPEINQMEVICRHYKGEYTVPLPELDEDEKPAIANLIYLGVESHATRVASVMPAIIYPSLHVGYAAADDRARDRKLATQGWWKMNNQKLKLRRRARFLTAYGTSPVTLSPVSIDPDDNRNIPFWRVRNPLTCYPAPSLDPDNMEPTNCMFVDYKPLAWLQARYPRQLAVLSLGDSSDTDMFTVLEYVDADETVFCVLGKEKVQKTDGYKKPATLSFSMAEILDRIPNRTGICPVVMPGRITLSGIMGQFDQLIGMIHREAKLDALNTIAVFRDVFPDEWVQSPANATSRPSIVEYADGKMGVTGIVENGQIVSMRHSPGPGSQNAMDNLERNQRISGAIPDELGGESGTNIRTARRGSQVMGSAIDMPIQEAQEILAQSLELENVRAVAIQKTYYGAKKSMFFFGRNGKITSPDYTPNEAFETDLSEVKYPMPGTDINGLIVAIGQRLGLGEMSILTAMIMDPAIDDPEEEYARVQVDALRKSILSGVEAQLNSGTMSPVVAARIISEMLQSRTSIEKALISVNTLMQQEQEKAQQAQAANQSQQPTDNTTQQPGIAEGTQPPVPAQGPPTDIQSLLEGLHTPQNLQGNQPTPSAKVAV